MSKDKTVAYDVRNTTDGFAGRSRPACAVCVSASGLCRYLPAQIAAQGAAAAPSQDAAPAEKCS